MQKIMNFEKIEMRVIIKLNEYIEYLGGFWGVWGGRISFLDQYAKQIIIISHHTKFEIASSKHEEVIQS